MRNPFHDAFSIPQRDARGLGLLAYHVLILCIAGILR
jgi:hypothetical protein